MLLLVLFKSWLMHLFKRLHASWHFIKCKAFHASLGLHCMLTMQDRVLFYGYISYVGANTKALCYFIHIALRSWIFLWSDSCYVYAWSSKDLGFLQTTSLFAHLAKDFYSIYIWSGIFYFVILYTGQGFLHLYVAMEF